jgi:serine protease Do
LTALKEIQEVIGGAAERIGPAVVGLGRGWHPGSGVIVAEGQVLTTAHNLRDDEVTVVFADGRKSAGRVSGIDAARDIAALAVDTADVEPIRWEPGASAPATGTPVLALANPGGRGLRTTLGFVTASERSIRGPRGRRISGCVEHNAALPRGSSGGPLVDADGGLLGLNAVRLEGGLIVAIPAGPELRDRLTALTRGELQAPVRLGVAVASPHVARRLRRAVGLPERDGVLVRAVEAQSPAAGAGIERGDLIVAANGRAIDGVDALYEALDVTTPRRQLELALLRGDEERTVTVSFGERSVEAEEASK